VGTGDAPSAPPLMPRPPILAQHTLGRGEVERAVVEARAAAAEHRQRGDIPTTPSPPHPNTQPHPPHSR
jgi:hypothetical protein